MANIANPPAGLAVRPVDRANVGDFEALFDAPGGPKHCWCMVWRRSAAEAKQNDSAGRKRQMMGRIAAGIPVGLLAYEEERPVAWVSVAPRETYRNLGGPPARDGECVWSIVCFHVPRKRRGAGTVHRLIAAAVDHARAQGATVVEAYPVPPGAPSYRFMGFVPVFERAGFVDAGPAGIRRRVMRRDVGQRPAAQSPRTSA